MPEPTEDKQDIDQLVAQADELVAELEAETAIVIQSASEEGPLVESLEWTPPPEVEEEPPVEEAAGADSEAAETDAEAVEETEEEAVTEQVADANEDAAESEVPTANEPELSAAPADTDANTVSEETTPSVDGSETASSEPEISVPTGEGDASLLSVGQDEVPAVTDDVAGPIDSDEAEVDSSPDLSAEAVCEIESDESAPEEPGDILADEESPGVPTRAEEPKADLPSELVQDSPETGDRIRSLDDELAKLADEMMEGDDDAEDLLLGETPEPEEVAAGAAADGESIYGPELSGDSVNGGDASVAASDSTPASATVETKGDGSGGATGNPEDFKQRVVLMTKGVARKGVEIARERGPIIAAQIEPVARKTCERVSKPLDKKKPVVRKAVGWVAVTTTIYACIVLFYVAFLRKPTVIDPSTPGTTLIDQSGISIANHPDG